MSVYCTGDNHVFPEKITGRHCACGKMIWKGSTPGLSILAFMGVPVEVRPDVPPGKLFFLNGSNMSQAYCIDARSRWQRLGDWFVYLRLRIYYKLTRRKRHAKV